jgi:hypothetical protein
MVDIDGLKKRAEDYRDQARTTASDRASARFRLLADVYEQWALKHEGQAFPDRGEP